MLKDQWMVWIKLMGIGLVVTSMLGCYKSHSVEEETDEVTSEAAGVYTALCRFWERCRPDKLDFFAGSDVGRCIAFYNCYFGSRDTTAVFEDSAECRRHIEDAACIDVETGTIRHKPVLDPDAAELTETDWIPEGPFDLGLTAGASTPNNKIGEALVRVLTIRGIDVDAERSQPA